MKSVWKIDATCNIAIIIYGTKAPKHTKTVKYKMQHILAKFSPSVSRTLSGEFVYCSTEYSPNNVMELIRMEPASCYEVTVIPTSYVLVD